MSPRLGALALATLGWNLFAFLPALAQDPHAGHHGVRGGTGVDKSPKAAVGETQSAGPTSTRSVWDPTIASFDSLKAASAPDVVTLEPGKVFEMRASVMKQSVRGRNFRRYAYNGSLPGPLLKVKQGAEVRVRFVNDTDAPTTIHSHGLRHDYRYDGAVGLGQPKPVAPGETFEYVLRFPDAGIFWYHPHVREDYQQDMGLMGNFLVEPSAGSHWARVNREEILMLDDMLAKAPVPYPTDVANHAIMGRYGDTLLVNGQENARLTYRPGEVVRLFLTNAANTRTFKLMMHGARMKLVGSDLSPFEREFWVDTVTIAPGERYVVEVKFPDKGSVELVNHTPQSMGALVAFEPKGEPVKKGVANFEVLRANTALKREIDAFVTRAAKAKVRRLELGVTMPAGGGHDGHGAAASGESGHGPHGAGAHAGHGNMHAHHAASPDSKGTAAKDVPWVPDDAKIEWEDGMRAMNEASTSDTVRWKMVDDSGKENMAVNWPLRKGEAVRILIDNSKGGDHPMQHPIHFHGQRFVVLSVNGKKVANRAWKDTVLVGRGDKVEIALDASNPGKWMAHCHISEHLTSGMMTGFEVK